MRVSTASPEQKYYDLIHAVKAGRTGQALGILKAVNGGVGDWRTLDACGAAASALGAHELALQLSSRAVEANPAEPAVLYNYATALRAFGRFGEAIEAYERVLTLAPDDYETWLHRSQIARATPDRNNIAALSARACSTENWRAQSHYRYALAKELDDLGRYDLAFENLMQGARIKRRNTAYDVRNDVATMETIARTFDGSWLQDRYRSADPDNDSPIFIVGLPRSGTTLVERVLASHPDVAGLGELTALTLEIVSATGNIQPRPNGKASLIAATANDIDLAMVGQRYVERARPLALGKARFTDKMPLNFLYLGILRVALPAARVVLVTRNPIDNCFSMFRTMFRDAYPFSYDLDECATYSLAYQRLIRHWRNLLGDWLLEIHYESFVRDFENQCRRLLAHCNLDWSDNCLNFERNLQPCVTASATQVRQPLYLDAIGAWSRYEPQLANFVDACGRLFMPNEIRQ